jgi:hypothetical protein
LGVLAEKALVCGAFGSPTSAPRSGHEPPRVVRNGQRGSPSERRSGRRRATGWSRPTRSTPARAFCSSTRSTCPRSSSSGRARSSHVSMASPRRAEARRADPRPVARPTRSRSGAGGGVPRRRHAAGRRPCVRSVRAERPRPLRGEPPCRRRRRHADRPRQRAGGGTPPGPCRLSPWRM